LTATVALVAALVAVPVAGTTGRYADAAGDSGTAPDLTGVTVAGDALGQVVFTISVNQVPAQGDVGVMLVLDTDLDPRTGEPTHGGADFVFVEDMVARKWSFGRWTGAAWDWDTPYATAEVWSSPTAVTISVNRSELGNSSAFNFYAISWLDELVDSAPDRGLWNYSFAADGPEIRRVLTATTPRSGPAAGNASPSRLSESSCRRAPSRCCSCLDPRATAAARSSPGARCAEAGRGAAPGRFRSRRGSTSSPSSSRSPTAARPRPSRSPTEWSRRSSGRRRAGARRLPLLFARVLTRRFPAVVSVLSEAWRQSTTCS